MSNWEEVKLGTLGKIATGKTPSTKVDIYWSGDIPFITPKDIQSSKHIWKAERYLSNEGMLSVKGSILPKDAICVSCIGNIGYVSMTTKQSISNQQINSIIVNDENDANFIYYLMKSLWPYFKSYEGQSTTLSILNKSQFSKIDVCIPKNKEIQKKIAGVLGALDDKIELNNKINNNLEQQTQALFKSWFVDFEPFGGTMPDDWKEINLSDIATFVGGYSYKGSELQTSSTAMATIKNFDRQGGFKLDGFKEILPSSKLKETQKADLFDILVAHTDLTQNADVIGNAEMLLSKAGYLDVIISMDVVKVMPQKGISKFLLAALLKDNRFKQHCLGYINGTTVLHLSKKALPEFTFAFPNSVDTVNELTQTLECLYKKLASNIAENTRLAQLRDSLLPKLMSGEIDVSNVDISALTSTDKSSFNKD